MLERFADAVARRRWWVLASASLLAVAALLQGRGLFGRMSYAVFYDPAADSTRAASLARTVFGEGDPDVVALYHLPESRVGSVAEPEIRDALRSTLALLEADPAVVRISSELTLGGARFSSSDGRSTFVVVSLRGDPHDQANSLPRVERLLPLGLPPRAGGALVVRPLARRVGAVGARAHAAGATSLVRGERLALPLTAFLLVVIFGSLVASLMALVIGGISMMLALGILALLARLMAIDAFAIKVVPILGPRLRD